jgi:hypothetical protein
MNPITPPSASATKTTSGRVLGGVPARMSAASSGHLPFTKRRTGVENGVRVASRGLFIPSGLHGASASLRAVSCSERS